MKKSPLKFAALLFAGLLCLIGVSLSTPALSGGVCALHLAGFRLRSDAVQWSVKIKSGSECIQGLRWSTLLIDHVSITDPPKLGRLVVQGPSFRYFANPDAKGADSFELSVSGTSLGVAGSSTIQVALTLE